MHYFPRLWRVIFLVAWLQACTVTQTSDLESRYSKVLSRGEYRSAALMLDDIASTGGEDLVAGRRERLAQLIRQTKEQTLRDVEVLTDQGLWEQAITRMRNTVSRLPPDKDLLSRLESLNSTRESIVEKLELELAQHNAQHLPREIEILQELSGAASYSQLARWLLSRETQTGHKLVSDLLACAEQSIRDGDLIQANYCLQNVDALANERQQQQIAAARRVLAGRHARETRKLLRKHAAAEKKLQVTEQRLEADEQQMQEVLAEDQAEELTQLKSDYRDAVSAGWWQSADEKLTELEKRYPGDPDLQLWREQLQVAVDSYVASRLRQGERYYSRGSIARALKTWRSVQRLAPENPELEAHIQRARKFLAKLNELENGEAKPD